MARFLIEVPHEPAPRPCLMAIEIFLKTGSHYLTHCDWGCMDGVHKAWITVDAASKEEALRIVPPAFRSQATVTQLDKFTLDQVQAMLAQHPA